MVLTFNCFSRYTLLRDFDGIKSCAVVFWKSCDVITHGQHVLVSFYVLRGIYSWTVLPEDGVSGLRNALE